MRFEIDPEIARAATLPTEFYRDREVFDRLIERVFRASWQALPLDIPEAPSTALPFVLLEGCLDEPLVLVRDADRTLRCLSNVCTHRGNLVVQTAGPLRSLRCGYHGRRFALDGRCEHMPEFEDVVGFPSAADHLSGLPLERLGPLAFTSLSRAPPVGDHEARQSFDALIAGVRERLGFAPLEKLVFESTRSYSVRAHWALYCDNYLEGFHVPFVHPELGRALDYGAYRTELFEWGTLQVGVARAGEDSFDAPEQAERVAAYYFWLFPNTMLNFYPWGLSLNVVEPIGLEATRIAYASYVWDESRRGRGAGGALDRVEQEDEAIVENVQRGMRSRLYRSGRYSPKRESGVHHFHRLLCRMLR